MNQGYCKWRLHWNIALVPSDDIKHRMPLRREQQTAPLTEILEDIIGIIGGSRDGRG